MNIPNIIYYHQYSMVLKVLRDIWGCRFRCIVFNRFKMFKEHTEF